MAMFQIGRIVFTGEDLPVLKQAVESLERQETEEDE